jgi:hypothetical protein
MRAVCPGAAGRYDPPMALAAVDAETRDGKLVVAKTTRWWRDRALWLALVLTSVILITRGVMIQKRLTRCIDDRYHIGRGLLYLHRDYKQMRLTTYNDPPLGEAIIALPLYVQGIDVQQSPTGLSFQPDLMLHGAPLEQLPIERRMELDQTFRIEISVWKAILALPMVAVFFTWARSLYGAASAWITLGMFLADASFAAHLPLPTLDVLAVVGIVISARIIWTFANRPTWGTAIASLVAIAISLCLKHTALVLPIIAIAECCLCWIIRKPFWRIPGAWKQWLFLGLIAIMTPVLLWPLTMFDNSPVQVPGEWQNDPAHGSAWFYHHHIPGGLYWSSFLAGMSHDQRGHQGLLLGERKMGGWKRYFIVVAAYKIPLGIAAILLLGICSPLWVKFKFAEWSLAIPALACTALMVKSNIDIGFRHFLPSYLFFMMLTSRAFAEAGRWLIAIGWTAIAAAAIHVLSVFPDFLSYTNFPREYVYTDISDSNIDWGQGLKEMKGWLNRHPTAAPIYIGYFGPMNIDLFSYYNHRPVLITNRHKFIAPDDQHIPDPRWIPNHGVLLMSPVLIGGAYDPMHKFDFLWLEKPDDVIGHTILVFNLDRLDKEGKIPPYWTTLK